MNIIQKWAGSPTKSLFGPTSMEFQFHETCEGQFVKPSWCLLVSTTYLWLETQQVHTINTCMMLQKLSIPFMGYLRIFLTSNMEWTSPPQSYLGRAHHYPHIGECTLSLRVLAVTCTMHYKVLRKHYGALQNRCASLQNVTEHYGTFGSIAEALQGVLVLQSVTKHYGALQDVTECYESITKNIDFAHH